MHDLSDYQSFSPITANVIGLIYYGGLTMNYNPYFCSIFYEKAQSSSAIVTPMMDGLVEWFENIFNWKALSQAIINPFDYSKAAIWQYFPVVKDQMQLTMIMVGAIIALSLFGLHIVLVNLNYASDSSQKQSFIDLLIRLPITIVLIVAVSWLIKAMDDILLDAKSSSFFTNSITSMAANTANKAASDANEAVADLFAETLTGPFKSLILLILGMAVLIEVIKLLLEIAERNVILWTLDLCAPVAAGTYVSRTTSNIFTNYLRMYANQCFLIFMNGIFLAIIEYMIADVFNLSHVNYLILVLAVLKTAQRIDFYMKSLGMTTAQTMNGLLGSIGMAGMAIGGLIKSGKNGAATVGSMMTAKGVSTGNLGMSMLGNTISNRAKGNYAAATQDAGLKSFATQGGFANASIGSTGTVSAAVSEARKGNFTPIRQLSPDVRTEAIKQAIGPDGMRSISEATGLDMSKASTIDIDERTGALSGTANVTTPSGNMPVSFQTSAAARTPNASKVMGIGGECYISTKPTSSIPNGFRSSNTALMSTMTGTPLNTNALNGLGVTDNVYNGSSGKGFIEHYNKDSLVGFTDTKTGNLYSNGLNYSHEGQDKPDFVAPSDFFEQNKLSGTMQVSNNGLIGNYDFGKEPNLVANSFRSEVGPDGTSRAYFEIENNSKDVTAVMVQRPTSQMQKIAEGNRSVSVKHLDNERGDVAISFRKVNQR